MISALNKHDPRSPAIFSCADNRAVNYEQLCSMVDRNRQMLERVPRPALALLSCENSVGSLCAYLGCLAADVPVCLVESRRRAFDAIVNTYRPSLVLLPNEMAPPDGYRSSDRLADGGYRLDISPQHCPYATPLHASLALLLTTSGSTGSRKLVRLSHRNVASNAASIVDYLKIGSDERSIQSLPMQYAYGLSLVNSHLLAGATVVLTPHSFMTREFWLDFDRAGCTSFAGVPYTYELLRRLRFNPAGRPTLRTMTQAGGGLSASLLQYYHETAERNRKSLVVMYGQTEATARIAYVPPDRLSEKMGAIGQAIPQGRLSLEPIDDAPGLNQLIYEGPNVMLGYATGPGDLALGETQHGILRTGDLARVDEDGFYYVVGRMKRIAKVFGRRVNLADIENEMQDGFACRIAAVDRGNRIHLFVENDGDVDLTAMRAHAANFLSLMPLAIRVERIEAFPRTASGKINYSALTAVPPGA
ncbi:MAG: AMP-binding protein [Pirellulaceae bacterium]